MDIQHFNVKVFVAPGAAVHLPDFIGIFHGWIQRRVAPELLVDVADYAHVPAGPGVLLIGHEAAYSLDLEGDRPGLLYNRKTVLAGDTQAKLAQAAGAALAAARRLEEENGLAFNGGDLQVIVNDRFLAPNTPETFAALRPDLEAFFTQLFGAGGFTLESTREPRERFTVAVRANSPHTVAALLARLPQPVEAAHA